ncbi:hypothetical protein ACFR9U_19810 [Halorientalis brevis]|uniref:DUF7321 domain-containing protein n=1 Tax=Halorientalis brevis TaxID=1126241 RepID=A0ABD6CG73_9EURY|nr:hypothetical protein [Halorientalis brevis]
MALSDGTIATGVLVSVTLSFPCFLYGAWIMIDADEVTWGVLTHHLKFIATGLTLTTVPLLGWMLPRLVEQLNGFAAIHAFLGLQAYAMLAFGFTGIVRVFRAKWEHDLYHDYDEDVLLDEIGSDRLQFFRRRIRIGVFGYVFFWILAYLVGVARYLMKYWLVS